MFRRLAALPLLLLAAACASTSRPPRPAAPQEPVHLVFVSTTDLHGFIDGRALRSDSDVPVGGLEALSAYLANLRAAHPDRVVLLDGGDLFQGTLASNLFEGEPVVKAYNLLGYDAAAVGNHEFDYGPVGPLAVARNASEDPLGALKRNVANARYAFLANNVTEKATARRPAWLLGTKLIARGGVKVGIVGLATPETPSVTMAANVTTLDFGEPAQAVVAGARELRAAGADVVVVAAHIGSRCKDVSNPLDLSSCNEKDSFDLVRALPPGTIDALFGGHTHQQTRHLVEGVPVLQPAPNGRQAALLDLWVDPAGHRVLPEKTVMRPLQTLCLQVYAGTDSCDPGRAPKGAALVPASFEGRPLQAAPAMVALLKPYREQVERKRAEDTGLTLTAPFTREYVKESALGNLLSDAARSALGTDFAFFNSGGLRANLRGPRVTYGDLYEVIPFDNLAAIVTVTGAQVREMLRLANDGTHGLTQVSGLRMVLDATKDMDKPPAQRDRIREISLPGGEPLEPERLYKVAMSDFMAGGGDGMIGVTSTLPPERVAILYDRPPLRDILAEELRRMAGGGPLTPQVGGRVTVMGGEEGSTEH